MLRLSRDAGEAKGICLIYIDLSSKNAKFRTKNIGNTTLLLTF